MIRPIEKFEKELSEIAQLVGQQFSGPGVFINGVTNHSGEVEPGDLFLAFPGLKVHGANFVSEAIKRGARAVLTDKAGAAMCAEAGLPIIDVANPRWSAGNISAWFYGEPMRDMFSVGITGTNGKTTTTTLLGQLWSLAGRESGLIGTIETRIGKDVFKSARTTPESPELQALAATMRERHISHFAMEVSSHAIALERMRGSHFNVVAFTNLTQDHLDFHKSMDAYFETKAKLFTYEYADLAFLNIDDEYVRLLVTKSEIPTISLSRCDRSADWHYESFYPSARGYEVVIRGSGGILIEGLLPLHGDYNLDNALMAVAIASESGVDPLLTSMILPTLRSAEGRLDQVSLGQAFLAFVDYAHSPDAVERVLETCKRMTSGKVIAVLGCGGDRDSLKRPLMGKALLIGSDVAVFTSDNPRSEEPAEILSQMVAGAQISGPSAVILDRHEAISYAVKQAKAGDVVVILGKGHEQGQEIRGEIYPFDDRLILAQEIEALS